MIEIQCRMSRFLKAISILSMLGAGYVASAVGPETIPSVASSQDEGWVTVEVEGRGDSVATATQDAIANGLRRIVGEYVTAETVIENEEIVEDLIKSFTVGQQVLTEPVGSPRFEGTTVVVGVKVSAEPREINEKFEKAAASAIYMDGETLASELEFAANNLGKQREILQELVRELPARLLVARLIDREGRPIDAGRIPKDDIKRLPDGSHVVALNIECYFDLGSWYRKVEPRLREALSAMAVESQPAALSIEYESNARQSHLFSLHPFWWARGTIKSRLPNGTTIPFGHAGLFVSRARDADGRAETFDYYLLPKSLMVFETTSASTIVDPLMELGIIAIDQEGVLLDRWTASIKDGVVSSRDGTVGQAIPVSGGHVLEWAAFPRGLYNGTGNYVPHSIIGRERGSRGGAEDGWVGLLTPRFGSGSYNAGWGSVSDVIVLRVELTMPPGHLEELAAFVFDPTTFGNGATGSPRQLTPGQGLGFPNRKRPTAPTADPNPGGPGGRR